MSSGARPKAGWAWDDAYEVRPRFRYYSAGDPDPPFVESDDRTVLVPEAEFSAATVTGGFIEVDAIVAECLPQDLAKHIAAASPAIIAREQLTLELPRRREFAECMTVQDGSDLDARVVASLAWCLPATDSNQHVDDGGPVDIEILLDESTLIDEVVIAGELRLERDGQVVAFGEVVIPTWLPACEARISIELRASSRPGAEQSSWALQALTRPRTTAEAYPQSEWARDRLVLRANPRLAIRAHLRPTCWEGEIVVPRGTCSEW